jgi:predicted transcriptional regulator
MQIDWYVYEHDMWNQEIPAGRQRVEQGMAPRLAGRVVTPEAVSARVLRGEAEEQPV